MLFFWWVKLKENAFNRQLRYFMVISGVYSSAACDVCCCPAVQLAAGHGVTAVCTAVCCVCVCACVLFFFLSFSFNFNFELCACLLFAVCDKWVDFRGGDAVHQSNALLIYCTSIMYHTLQTWHASSIIAWLKLRGVPSCVL